MTILRLPTHLRDRCTSIARAALPNEACALVAGHVSDIDVVVTQILPVRNALASPTSFALDGKAMIATEQRIDEAGETLVGILHSHPTSEALPSAKDLGDAQRYDPSSVFVQLIVSMQGFAPTLRAFRYGPTLEQTVQIAVETAAAP